MFCTQLCSAHNYSNLQGSDNISSFDDEQMKSVARSILEVQTCLAISGFSFLTNVIRVTNNKLQLLLVQDSK